MWERFELNQGHKSPSAQAEGPNSKTAWFLRHLIARRDNTIRVEEPSLRRWDTEDTPLRSWAKPTADWRRILGKNKNDDEQLNNRWNTTWNCERWKSLWMKLWKTGIFLRDKTWLWRFLHNGFFLNDRALKMNVDDGICKRCSVETETGPDRHRSGSHRAVGVCIAAFARAVLKGRTKPGVWYPEEKSPFTKFLPCWILL
ncbi:hypothetical protein R1flu_008718 [Riccia fluitans]|uniref:Reverse transcriptase zinc-binding domain-containing protein n=1 Tax=Riccia fluitans TaxID=41844 RepID=A0ABD1YCI9_9MARC